MASSLKVNHGDIILNLISNNIKPNILLISNKPNNIISPWLNLNNFQQNK